MASCFTWFIFLLYRKPVGEEIWVGKSRELGSQADLNHIHSQAGTETQLRRVHIMPGFMIVRLPLSWDSEITPLRVKQYLGIHCVLQTASVMTHMCWWCSIWNEARQCPIIYTIYRLLDRILGEPRINHCFLGMANDCFPATYAWNIPKWLIHIWVVQRAQSST